MKSSERMQALDAKSLMIIAVVYEPASVYSWARPFMGFSM